MLDESTAHLREIIDDAAVLMSGYFKKCENNLAKHYTKVRVQELMQLFRDHDTFQQTRVSELMDRLANAKKH